MKPRLRRKADGTWSYFWAEVHHGYQYYSWGAPLSIPAQPARYYVGPFDTAEAAYRAAIGMAHG